MSTPPNGAQHRNEMHRIVVATDGSSTSAEAVDLALELAAEHASELLIVHVVSRLDAYAPLVVDGIGTGVLHFPTAYDHELLHDAASKAAARGVSATTALLQGSPAGEIIAYAELHDADLVVVGSRGHGAVASAILGSVSMSVLQGSRRPVIIVRGTQPRYDGALSVTTARQSPEAL